MPVQVPVQRVISASAEVALQVKAGAMLNVLGVLSVTLCIHTWAMAFFDLNTIPWQNSTLSVDSALFHAATD